MLLSSTARANENHQLSKRNSAERKNFLQLSISGTRYILSRHNIIMKRQHGLLETLAASKLQSNEAKAQLCDYYCREKDVFYFDRSARLFDSIAGYYRSGIIHCPNDVCTEEFFAEMDFWGLEQRLISNCCRDKLGLSPLHAVMEGDEQRVPTTVFGLTAPFLTDHGLNGHSVPSHHASLVRIQTPTAEDEEDARLAAEIWDVADPFKGLCLEKHRRNLWNFMEAPESSKGAKVFSWIASAMVAISVINLVLSSVPSMRKGHISSNYLKYMEYICVTWFTSEYLIRFFVSPSRCKFARHPMNLIDLVSIMPFYTELAMTLSGKNPDELENVKGAFLMTKFFRMMRVVRVIRVLKMARYNCGMQTFGTAIKESSREIFMLFTFIFATILLSSTVVYYLENDQDNTEFTSIPAAFWWCIVTLTTVGYGDMIPVTIGGKLVGAATGIAGVVVLAFPLTIMIENFGQVYRRSKMGSRRSSRAESSASHARNSVQSIF